MQKITNGLPLISKLDSEGDSAPDAGSDEDVNLDDEEDLGALNFQMNRNSVIGASSGRGFANFKYRVSGVNTKATNPEEIGVGILQP